MESTFLTPLRFPSHSPKVRLDLEDLLGLMGSSSSDLKNSPRSRKLSINFTPTDSSCKVFALKLKNSSNKLSKLRSRSMTPSPSSARRLTSLQPNTEPSRWQRIIWIMPIIVRMPTGSTPKLTEVRLIHFSGSPSNRLKQHLHGKTRRKKLRMKESSRNAHSHLKSLQERLPASLLPLRQHLPMKDSTRCARISEIKPRRLKKNTNMKSTDKSAHSHLTSHVSQRAPRKLMLPRLPPQKDSSAQCRNNLSAWIRRERKRKESRRWRSVASQRAIGKIFRLRKPIRRSIRRWHRQPPSSSLDKRIRPYPSDKQSARAVSLWSIQLTTWLDLPKSHKSWTVEVHSLRLPQVAQ